MGCDAARPHRAGQLAKNGRLLGCRPAQPAGRLSPQRPTLTGARQR
jgi:hypothetical protein